MSPMHGRFVWYELVTPDVAKATAFYAAAVGWTAAENTMTGEPYTIVSADGHMLAGVMPAAQLARPGHDPVSPHWLGYVACEDVDATAAAATAAGGSVLRAPGEIPNVGRFAVIRDPVGAVFIAFHGNGDGMTPTPPSPGRFVWHELHSRDQDAAFAFYSRLFGWTEAGRHDMGPMGSYAMFSTGDTVAGGMMSWPDGSRPAGWLYYVSVPEIDAAIARITAAGGTILNGPQPVPGGSMVAQALDDQGAAFAIVSPPAA